jgi:hypothetical protein
VKELWIFVVVQLDLYEWNSRQIVVQNSLIRSEIEGKWGHQGSKTERIGGQIGTKRFVIQTVKGKKLN